MKNKKIVTYSTWILKIILGLLFLAAGAGKFLADHIWIEKFSDWGFPDKFYIFIGLIEILAAILLFIPKLSKYAAIVLIIIMIGAVGTHIIHNQIAEIIRPVIFLILLSIHLVLYKRISWKQFFMMIYMVTNKWVEYFWVILQKVSL